MNTKHARTDLELLGHLKAFSWLSSLDKTHLLSALETANFTKHDVIVRESELASDRAHSARRSGQHHLPERKNRTGNGRAARARADPGVPDGFHSLHLDFRLRLTTIAGWAA